jgi:hypothetical protein
MRRFRQVVGFAVLALNAVPLSAGTPSSGIYWSYQGPTIDSAGAIWRADFDGSNIQAIVTQRLDGPWPVVADVFTHKIYWGDVDIVLNRR